MMKNKEQLEHECSGARQAIALVSTIGDLFFEKMVETNGGQLPLNIISTSYAIQKDPRTLLVKVPTCKSVACEVLAEDDGTRNINCNDYVIATALGVYSLEEFNGIYYVSYKGILLDGTYLADKMKGRKQ